MAARPDREPSWFRLPKNWIMDEHLIGVPEGAKLLFLLVVEFCDSMQNGGTLTVSQLHTLSKPLTRGRQCADRLLAAGALIPNSSLAEGWQFSSSFLTDGRQTVSIALADRWLSANNTPPSISAGKKDNAPAKAVENVPHAGARKKTDRQTDREEGRTPSGSVRPSSARAVPRVAGGAAQPAPDPEAELEVDEGGTLPGAVARAQMAEMIKQTQATNPNSTGKSIRFSKFDDDRYIEPINSALQNGWAEE